MKKYIVIYKYELEIAEEQIVELPYKSKILTVQMQDNTPVMWVEVEHGTLLTENRKIILLPTGRISNELEDPVYIATVQDVVKGLVWHFYDGGEV